MPKHAVPAVLLRCSRTKKSVHAILVNLLQSAFPPPSALSLDALPKKRNHIRRHSRVLQLISFPLIRSLDSLFRPEKFPHQGERA